GDISARPCDACRTPRNIQRVPASATSVGKRQLAVRVQTRSPSLALARLALWAKDGSDAPSDGLHDSSLYVCDDAHLPRRSLLRANGSAVLRLVWHRGDFQYFDPRARNVLYNCPSPTWFRVVAQTAVHLVFYRARCGLDA